MTATMTTSREIRLAARPSGTPTLDDFDLVEVELAVLQDGQVLVRNEHLSVDPYMRGRMDDRESYIPPFALGAPLDGAAVGVVVESRAAALAPGDIVSHLLSWRELAVGDAGAFQKVEVPPGVPASAYLGVLGIPGLTAYVGLLELASLQPGDTVFVSGAAGAVGSAAGQIARLKGAARVIGSAGSAAKVAHLEQELGFDAAFDYHDAPVEEQLRAAAPDGIDVVFDNVGGDHLEAAIASLNDFGRIALCGAIAGYNDERPATGPRNLFDLIAKRITARGFIVLDHMDRMPAFLAEMEGWIARGELVHRETVVEGLENMPDAFLGLFRGDNLGKMVVTLPPRE